jgi:hypothetical protein
VVLVRDFPFAHWSRLTLPSVKVVVAVSVPEAVCSVAVTAKLAIAAVGSWNEVVNVPSLPGVTFVLYWKVLPTPFTTMWTEAPGTHPDPVRVTVEPGA